MPRPCEKGKWFASRSKLTSNVQLIDDDCALSPNFPVVSDRLVGRTKVIGYTIKSVRPNSSKGIYANSKSHLKRDYI